MSYSKDLDEYTEDQLLTELKNRAKARSKGLCDYCGRHAGGKPCKFPERHRMAQPAPPEQKFKIGDWPVRTVQNPNSVDDWTTEARASRKWDEVGMVIAIHDAHGLSYEVMHDSDGTVGHYNQDELQPAETNAIEKGRDS